MRKLLILSLLALVFIVPAFGQENAKEGLKITKNPSVQPEFPGGTNAMMNFIASNVKYPQDALEKNAEGNIFVQFIVEKDGSLTNPEILRGGETSLQAEALRLIGQMPKWSPGKDEDGNNVRTSQILPVKFTLSN